MEGRQIPLPRVTTLSLPAAFCAAEHLTVYSPGCREDLFSATTSGHIGVQITED